MGGKALARMRVSGKKVKRASGRWNLKRGSQLPNRDHQKATKMCSEFHDLCFCNSARRPHSRRAEDSSTWISHNDSYLAPKI